MKSAVNDNVVGKLKDGDEANPSYHAGDEWATVAEAFFKNGISPSWTTHDAGKAAFSSTMGPELPADPSSMAIFGAAFVAYAATCVASTAPGAGFSAPPVPPPAPPVWTMSLDASDSADTMVDQLLTDLVTWALTGMQTLIPPAVGTSPPWS